MEWWAAVQRPQRRGLAPLEPLERRLAGRAVDPNIRDLACPGRKMRLEGRPARKAPAGDRVALDVADAALVLALGACSIRRAGPRPEAPVLGESVQPGVEPYLARRCVVSLDQGPRIVEQHLLGRAAERRERALDAGKPALLRLAATRPHMQPPRETECRHEQGGPYRHTADQNPTLAEVDLQLPPRRRLEPHRRARLGRQPLPQCCAGPLDRAQAQGDPQL